MGKGVTIIAALAGPGRLPQAGSLLALATTITGDTPCRSTNVDYRLDTELARAFLGQYVSLP